MDIETAKVGVYLEQLGKAIQDGDVLVKSVGENRQLEDGADSDLTIEHQITFKPCAGVVLDTGVPYDDGLPNNE
jgi:hypothetical protein